MRQPYTVAELREEVANIVAQTIRTRRGSLSLLRSDRGGWVSETQDQLLAASLDEQALNAPPTAAEIDEFIAKE